MASSIDRTCNAQYNKNVVRTAARPLCTHTQQKGGQVHLYSWHAQSREQETRTKNPRQNHVAKETRMMMRMKNESKLEVECKARICTRKQSKKRERERERAWCSVFLHDSTIARFRVPTCALE